MLVNLKWVWASARVMHPTGKGDPPMTCRMRSLLSPQRREKLMNRTLISNVKKRFNDSDLDARENNQLRPVWGGWCREDFRCECDRPLCGFW